MIPGLYIHLPFCKRKCNYCDFASFCGKENRIDDYLRALFLEAASGPVSQFHTLYVGGGTPSLLSCQQLEVLCRGITDWAGEIRLLEESTFEANPESLTREKIELLKAAGFNRFSVGLQSFCDKELKILGRVHNVADFLRTWKDLRVAGVQNINVDLIAGVPEQTLESFVTGLDQLISLRPEHVSVYGLQIEEGTPFFEKGVLPDQLLMRTLLEQARAKLLAAGYHHYEISNFALPGFESKHNTRYWQYADYVGLGSAAASFIGGQRRQNVPDMETYIGRIDAGQSPVDFTEHLTGKTLEGEKLMVGLRQLDGVELTSIQQEFFGPDIARHIEQGLLLRDGKKVKLSEEGLYVANEVFCSFVAPFEEI